MAASPLVPPLVSVIIPALNAGATLGRALDFVAAQTYPQWEAIVIDDGSSDDTAPLVERRGDPRCRVIRRTVRGGPSRARNDGIAAARGALIALLDADDEWLPQKLERQVAALARHPAAALAVCDMLSVHEDGSAGIRCSRVRRRAPDPRRGRRCWPRLSSAPRRCWRRAICCKRSAASSELRRRRGPGLFIRLALRGEVVVLPEALAIYHYRHASYSAAYAGDQARIVLGMVRRHLAAERLRLSWSERRRILAQRYGRLGRNLIAAGARGRGIRLILEAACLGSVTIENLSALLHAFRG